MGPGTCPQLPPTTWLADLSLIVVMIFARPPDLFPDCRLDCGSSAPVGGPVPGLSVMGPGPVRGPVPRLRPICPWAARFADLSFIVVRVPQLAYLSLVCRLWVSTPGSGYPNDTALSRMRRVSGSVPGRSVLSNNLPWTARFADLSLIVALSPKVTRSSLRLRPTGTKVSARRFNPGTSVRI